MLEKINLSVHQLVDFLLRKGDIDDRLFNNKTMEEGSEIHRKFQKKQKANYFSEVDLKTTIVFENYEINLHGRADGIIIDDIITIDEIKSTNGSLDDFNSANEEWHLGQAECYAYIYCKTHNLKNIRISLTYLSQVNSKTFVKYFDYTYEILENRISQYIYNFFNFYSLIRKKIIEKNISIKKLCFPFSLRKGQSEIIKFSQECIENEDVRFIEASTGLGKTISIMFGALKGGLKKKIDKIFFLAAKNSGFKSANDCLDIFRENGLKITSCEILGKEKMCRNKNHNCNPDDCPFARNYYDKLNSLLIKILSTESNLSSDTIMNYAIKNIVCPFELSLDLSLYSDVIVMDYNYFFNPISYLRRFFDVPEDTYNNFVIVDESHNLIDRSRDMYSASINNEEFKIASKSYNKIKCKSIKSSIKNLAEDFNLFSQFESDENYIQLETLDQDFINHLNTYQNAIRDYSKKHPKFVNKDDKEFNIDLFKFLTIYGYYDVNYRIFIKKDENNFSINLFCIDASSFIRSLLAKTKGSLFFSGTLTPMNYYKKAILGNDEYQDLIVDSPYDKDNLLVLYNNKISIRYKDRENSLQNVITLINSFISSKIGNYIVYVPSFAYLHMLKNNYINDDINLLYQNDQMSKADKDNFLLNFVSNPKRTTLGICVLGGSFGEGIDLVNDRLIGIIVIGVGLPSISFENNLIKTYYDLLGLDGYNFAYTNPGINKVMQAIGRLIRSETDRGIALLIDNRYLYKDYSYLFKTTWINNKKVVDINSLIFEINSFYNK